MTLNPGVREIQDKRRKLLEGLDANAGFEQGLHDSAIDQYAGKCHFIYELLQNAGDAGATEVEFTLTPDSLEFRHNGPRLFRLEDVNSITNYHRSTKRGEDYETVGKFGMGFKSVFFYTTAPEIHSGDYHFRIDRMFYPATEGVRTDELLNGWTKFIFPFVHRNRTTTDIFREVKKGLSEIRGETLLFLRKIRRIECLLDNGRHLQIERDESDHIVRIRRKVDGSCSNIYFLKFTNVIAAADRNLEIGIAYGLEPDRAMLTNGDMSWLTPNRFTIKPIRGKVFVYFPAEKEISNLQFHINAPFATPMSRESLTENGDNESILRELAHLTVGSLPFLRDNGLLTTETLSVFPIDKDQLPQKYLCFKICILNAFNTQELTPTKSGSFKRADQLMRSENRMSDLFSDEDMVRIYRKYQAPVWVKAPMIHSREDDFISALDLRTFGNADLEGLVTNGDSVVGINFLHLIATFDDKKLLDLYRKVSTLEIAAKTLIRGDWTIGPIFRATDGRHYRGYELYFASGVDQSVDDEKAKFLKPIFKDSDSTLISFFKVHGVKECSPDNILRTRLRSVVESRIDERTLGRHMDDVRLLLRVYRESPAKIATLRAFRWLCMSSKNSNGLILATADRIIIDEPYEKTGMRVLNVVFPSKYVIAKTYAEKLSKPEMMSLCRIMTEFDFIRSIQETYVESACFSEWGHPRHRELDIPCGCHRRDVWYRDCKIEGLNDLLKNINDEVSKRLWKLLVSLQGSGYTKNPFQAICHYNDSCIRTADSLLVCGLQERAWIKGVDNEWHRPADINFATLHAMYEPRNSCSGLRAVKFGSRVLQIEQANSAKKKEREEYVRSLGASSEDELREAVEQVREAKKLGIDIKGQILKKQNAVAMPENPSGNIERRQQHAKDDYSLAEGQTRDTRERTVKTSNSMAPQARERLLRDYTDDARQMRCQLCRQPMPFNKRDGEPYFECVQVLRDMKKESPDQYLALCPTCCAAYDEWVRKLEANAQRLRKEIVSREVRNGQGAVTILLPDQGTPNCRTPPTRGMSLYFVATHFADLKAVLEEEDA